VRSNVQKLVLKKMVDAGFIAEDEATEAAKLPLRFRPPSSVANKAPYFTDFVKAEMIRQLKDRDFRDGPRRRGFSRLHDA